MGMTVKRRKDTRTPLVIMHKVADIRGGVSVNTAELGGDYLKQGTALSAPLDGICHVVKTAEVFAEVADSSKEIKVKKFHNFKTGDFVMIDADGKASSITKIDTANKEYDTLTLKEAIGPIAIGGCIAEAKAEAAESGAELKYIPLSIVGTGKIIEPKSNIDTDAWIIAVTHGNNLPVCVSKHLTGIFNY